MQFQNTRKSALFAACIILVSSILALPVHAHEVTHPLLIEELRTPPNAPPPARLFVSSEARFAIAQGWLCGESYDESRIATHAEAVALLLFLTGGDPNTALSSSDFYRYLSLFFADLPEDGILGLHSDGGLFERDITFGDLARAAYRLRGFGAAIQPTVAADEVDSATDEQPIPREADEFLEHLEH